jgi:hypothetical protein
MLYNLFLRSENMIVGVTGLIGSGKSTVANILATNYGFRKMAFADALKDCVSVIFSWDRILLEGETHESREWREQVDDWWANQLNIPNLTPRWVLQQWGTDVARKGFHNDIWIASLNRRLQGIKDDIVITDCRFANELTAIKNAGGITVRTHRGPDPAWLQRAIFANTSPHPIIKMESKTQLEELGIHASEYSSVGLDYDFALDNNGTIPELYEQVENILTQLRG